MHLDIAGHIIMYSRHFKNHMNKHLDIWSVAVYFNGELVALRWEGGWQDGQTTLGASSAGVAMRKNVLSKPIFCIFLNHSMSDSQIIIDARVNKNVLDIFKLSD